MEFKELPPRFNLNLSLEEAIQLYKIVNHAYSDGKGNLKAKSFLDELDTFAKHSNLYTGFLEGEY